MDTLVVATIETLERVFEGVLTRMLHKHDATPNRGHVPQQPSKALTFSDVARRLRISAPTLRGMLQRGDIAAFRVGSNWRITEEALAAYQKGMGDA